MKRSEVNLKVGDKVVIDYATGVDDRDYTFIVYQDGEDFRPETGGWLDRHGIANIGPLPWGFAAIEVNGETVTED